ncbi:MAG: SMI1/KNR4 family protein [Micavibrio sp.]|nr:SMI1/KNR4 family protein [Micavibrio sp.]
MNIFEKVDAAFKALQNAEGKTEFAPPVSNEDIERLNNILDAAKLPHLPVDFMYLLRKFGGCKGPYFEIYGLCGLHGTGNLDDLFLLDDSLYLNRGIDDDEPKGLLLGCMPRKYTFDLEYKLVYKDGAYHHVEDDRGVMNYFQGLDNIGDFIIKEIKAAMADKRRRDVEKWSD